MALRVMMMAFGAMALVAVATARGLPVAVRASPLIPLKHPCEVCMSQDEVSVG